MPDRIKLEDSAMPPTLTLPEDLALQLQPYEGQLRAIVELGIREFRAREEAGYNGVSTVLEKLASLPSPEEVLALRPTPMLQQKLDALLEKNRAAGLSPEDQREWEQFKYLEHLIRLAKASALRKLMDSKGP
jgi:hypothetical protein